MTITPGIYPGADRASLRCPSRPLSQTDIKILLNKTPADLKYREPKTSDAMNFGSVVHKLSLGKGAKFSISPFDDYRTNVAREWKDETISSGLIPIKQADYDAAETMAAIVRDRIRRALDGAAYETEVPFVWREGDVWCAGTMDVWCADRLTIIDPKVTAFVHHARTSAHILNMGFDIQNAWYRRGIGKIMPEAEGRVRFANLMIDPDPPHSSRMVTINESWRYAAEKKCLRALEIYRQCVASDTWPGYSGDIEELDMPAWELRAVMEQELDE